MRVRLSSLGAVAGVETDAGCQLCPELCGGS